MPNPRPPTCTGGTKIARQGLAFSVPWAAYRCASTTMQGEPAMSRARKLLGSALMAALSLATVGVTVDSATADTTALCVGPPGGLPLTVAQWAEGARLFGGLGDFHRVVSTNSPQAQAYFDQGMRLLWAFNHDEATRSFAKAAGARSALRECLVGRGTYGGSELQHADDGRRPAPRRVGPRSRRRRSTPAGDSGRARADRRSRQALRLRSRSIRPMRPDPRCLCPRHEDGRRAFPDDLDVQTMYAEALMNITAWKLWT